jgi:hypothetical protein
MLLGVHVLQNLVRKCKKEQSYANDNKAMQMLAKTADY